jgi:hypothetical protein
LLNPVYEVAARSREIDHLPCSHTLISPVLRVAKVAFACVLKQLGEEVRRWDFTYIQLASLKLMENAILFARG